MDQHIQKYDITIVGGSIAGNYLCYLLSNLNLKIIVLEEHADVGLPLQCAGIVSQKLAELIELPETIVLNRVNVAKLVAPSGMDIKLSGNETPYIIDRVALDRLFYEKCKNKTNVHYSLGEKFKSFEASHGNSLKIQTSRRMFDTNLLIGCDGPLSSVGKQLNIKNKNITAAQIRIKGKFPENEAVMYFDPRWKELFGWIVPEGNNTYRVGLATSKKTAIKFQLFLKRLGITPEEKIDQQGGLIPHGMMKRLAFNNILLIGDAAGQVKATTGGGIVMLLTAAKHASDCIQRCFEKQDFSKKFIKKYYENPCLSSIGKELKTHLIIRLVLENLSERDYDLLFHIISESDIKHLISLYGDMDFPKSLILKMLKRKAVISFLLRFLFKNSYLVLKILFVWFSR